MKYKYLLLIPVVLFSCMLCSYGQDKVDTVKCIMLVSDSSYPSNKVVWIKGYLVYHEMSTYIVTTQGLLIDDRKYLDVIKQPLTKSIIVWQSKEY